MKRINLILLIIIHSLLAIVTILANSLITDVIFIIFTLILLAKLVSLARYFLLNNVNESEQGEY